MRRTTKKNSAALTTRGTIKKTVIYVENEKLNTFYAEKARKKLKLETDE